MKIVLVVIVAICQALITSIPIYNKKLSDNRNKFPQNLTNSGRWMITLIVITILCTLCLFILSENDQAKFQVTLNDTLKNRDVRHEKREDKLSTIYKLQIDSSYKKSSQNFNEVILKYGLHFDSLNNKLVKNRDTEKRQTFIQKISPPEVYLDTIKVISYPNLMKRVTIYFKNQQDEAKNLNIKLFTMATIDGIFKKLTPQPQIINIEQVVNTKEVYFIFDFFPPKGSIKSYFIFMDGGYYDKNGKYYSFSNLSILNGDTYRMNGPQGYYREGIMGIFKNLYSEIKP